MIIKQNKVVYTAVFGNYDKVQPVNPEWDCDFICFSDNSELLIDGWQVVIAPINGEPFAQVNRRYKMLPHQYLAGYHYSLYVDGYIKIVSDPSPLFEKYLHHGVIAIPKHQDRDCLYKEADICIETGLVEKEITERQMERYANEGFPEKFGMTENGIILRKHFDDNVIELMDSWWDEYCLGGKRDQLSLSYLIWKKQIRVDEITESVRLSKEFFEISLHENEKQKSFIKRMAIQANANKHLNLYYKLISLIVLLTVKLRDVFFRLFYAYRK
jgi:hypothetical protein